MKSAPASTTLGIDFGTSNSAAGALVNGAPQVIALESGASTIPTAVFFDLETGATLIGNAANDALLEGAEGRYMRALKSVLGAPLMHETRQVLRTTVTLIDVIGDFLAEVKSRAEAASGHAFDYALSGRPVHFHSNDDDRDRQALADLTECYRRAGFKGVDFMYEPEAAAIANGAGADGSIGLIVDIGGGTSDFSLFAPDTKATHGIEIIASHGVRVGGTNFDRTISLDHVMPLLGKGAEIRFEMGPGSLPAPIDLFNDLATWEKIPFLYTAQIRRDVDRMRRNAVDPVRIARLATVLEAELGHEIAFAVERGKIAANRGDNDASVLLGMVERGLRAGITPGSLAGSVDPHAVRVSAAAHETLRLAGLTPSQVDRVVFVGGSSLMISVSDAMRAIFPHATFEYAEVLTAVVDGLAIAAAKA